MRKLLLAGAIALTFLTSCHNENGNDITSNNQKEMVNKTASRTTSDGRDISPELQAEIDAALAGTSQRMRVICTIGLGSVSGHSCIEDGGTIYQYSWLAQSYWDGDTIHYYTDPKSGAYIYDYTWATNSNCNCKR